MSVYRTIGPLVSKHLLLIIYNIATKAYEIVCLRCFSFDYDMDKKLGIITE